MNKNDFSIEYQALDVSSEEAERRLFSALSLLLDINDIYEINEEYN